MDVHEFINASSVSEHIIRMGQGRDSGVYRIPSKALMCLISIKIRLLKFI